MMSKRFIFEFEAASSTQKIVLNDGKKAPEAQQEFKFSGGHFPKFGIIFGAIHIIDEIT